MKTLPPLEFTLDGPGLTLEQIGAVLKHQQALKSRRRGGERPALGSGAKAREPATLRGALRAKVEP